MAHGASVGLFFKEYLKMERDILSARFWEATLFSNWFSEWRYWSDLTASGAFM